MIKYLYDKSSSNKYSIDTTFKIIPKSLRGYKLMTIYIVDKIYNINGFSSLICYIYDATEVLKKNIEF